MSILKRIVAKRISYFRKMRKLTQAELAEKAGISLNYLGYIERGKKEPSFSVIESIASALKIDPTDLFLDDKRKRTENNCLNIINNLSNEELEKFHDLIKVLKN